MDYDGFRQMVLGANLKTVKAGAAMDIYNQRNSAGNVNPIASYNKVAGLDKDEVGFDEEVVRLTL